MPRISLPEKNVMKKDSRNSWPSRAGLSSLFFLGLGLCLVVSLVVGGCGGREEVSPGQGVGAGGGFPLTVTDFVGRVVEIGEEPRDIVSLRPSNTEILFALGLGDRVRGVTSYCYYPEEAQAKEKIGDFTINVEKVISLDPDLILAAHNQEEYVDSLEAYGFTVVVLSPKSLDETLESILLTGMITGAGEEAQALKGEIARDIDRVREYTAGLAGEERPGAFILIDTEQLYTTGRDTFLNEMIEAAGGLNIAASGGTGYYVLSEEKLFAEDPDFILCTFNMSERVLARDNWQELKAVRLGQVLDIDDDLVSRPGPRVNLGLKMLFDLFHPGGP